MIVKTITVQMGTTHRLDKDEVFRMDIKAVVKLDFSDSASYAIREMEDKLSNHLKKAVERAIQERGEPRYAVVAHEGEKLAVILPDQLLDELHNSYEGYAGYSLEAARKYFGDLCCEGYEDIDCSDGDLSRLPEIGDYSIFTLNNEGTYYIALVKAEDEQYVRKIWTKTLSKPNISREKIYNELESKREQYEDASGEPAVVIDAIDGTAYRDSLPVGIECPAVFKNEIPF